MPTPEAPTTDTSVSFVDDTLTTTGPTWVPSPFAEPGEPADDGISTATPVFVLDPDHYSPLSQASYDPLTGELYLLFDYDRLLDTQGEWWAGRHIDAVTVNGQPFPLVIHDDAGPRDESGNYIFDRTTVFNEFTLQIGAERMGADGRLDLTFTDKEDGGGDTYYSFSLVLENDDGTVGEEEPPVEQPGGLVFAVNAGGEEFTASNGVTYQADSFGAGNSFRTGAEIAGTDDDTLYQSETWGSGGFTYEIPLENGTYDVELNFAEIWGGAQSAGARVFDIFIEGKQVFDDLDITDTAGFNTAVSLIGQVEVTDGSLTITTSGEVQNPKISAFSVWEASGQLGEAFTIGSIADIPERNVLTFTEGDDTVFLSDPADEVQLLGGNDQLRTFAEVGVIDAGAGNDQVVLQAVAGTVDLGEGDNILNALASAGVVTAGDGADRVTARADLGSVETGDGGDTLLITANVDTVNAGSGNDTISITGNASVEAGDGDDTVTFRGDGFVSGGDGSDTIDFSGNGLVYGGSNSSDPASDNDTVTFSGTGSVLTFAGDDVVNFNGFGTVATGLGNDTVTIGAAADGVTDTEGRGVVVETLFGDDRVIVNAETSAVRVFTGNNAVQVNAFVGEIDADTGDDLVIINPGGSAGSIDLGDGNNVLTAFGDVQSVTTGDGFDRIETRIGAEIVELSSGAGDDLLFLQGNVGTVDAGAGQDTISLAGSGVVMGGDGNDTMINRDGGVDFFGGAGDDTFRFRLEASEADSFDGGDGIDTLLLSDFSFSGLSATRAEILESFGQAVSLDGPVTLDYGDQDTLFSELLNIEVTGVETLTFG